MKTIFLLFAFCLLLSCTGNTKVIETKNEYVVELMAEHEGCKLYKVHVPGHIGTRVYWTICKDKQVAIAY